MLQSGTLALLVGILLLQTRPILPPTGWLLLLPFVLAGIVFSRKPVVKLLCCLLAGFLWAQWHAYHLMQQRLPITVTHQTVLVRGVIASLPEHHDQRLRFEFAIDEVVSPVLIHFPQRVRLSWYSDQPPRLQPGDEWQLRLRLRTPHNFMNPASFDYSAWLLQKGIVAIGYVVNDGKNIRLGHNIWRYLVQQLRYRSLRFLTTALGKTPAAGLLKALIIGDRSGISPDQWAVLQQTGTVHLMAISGLHVGLVAAVVFFLVSRLWRLVPRICLIVPAPKAAAGFAWLAALLYAALAGFSIPTQRALIMLSVILLSIFLQRVHKPIQIFSSALLLVLLWDPFAVPSASFWLSFTAVALIYYVLQFQPRSTFRLQRWWRMQLAISLGLLPLVIAFFQQASIIAPFANLLAIPWVSMLVLPLAMLSSVLSLLSNSLATWGLHLAADLLQGLQTILAWFASLRWSLVYLPAPAFSSLLLAIAGISVMLLPRAVPARYLAILLCLPVFLPGMHRPERGDAQLSLLDVGQGLSAVIQTAQHTLVFDTGPRFSATFDTGEAVVAPYLRQAHIKQIDTLLISHSDMDHLGGAASLLKAFPVKQIISSMPRVLRNKRDTICVAGQQWRWDGVTFRILYPSAEEIEQPARDNDRSSVLQVSTTNQRILLTGDIEVAAEAKLIARFGKQLQSDVLVIPHHGSKTSSSLGFLDAVQPRLALIPAGWHNRFGFPDKTVIERLRARGLRVMNTATSGTIEIVLGRNTQIWTYREAYPRYWQSW